MTPATEAAAIRDLARDLLAIDARATELLRQAPEDMEWLLEQIAHRATADADALLHESEELDPTPAVLPLLAWAERRVGL